MNNQGSEINDESIELNTLTSCDLTEYEGNSHNIYQT